MFTQLVLARIVQPTSELDTIGVLREIGVTAPHEKTLYDCLRGVGKGKYRDRISAARWAHETGAGR